MKVPSKIRFGFFTISTILVPSLRDSDDSKLHGIFDFENLEIRIDKNQKSEILIETLWHELLHMVVHDMGIWESEDAEEKAIRIISPGILRLLRDNPKLVDYLCQALKRP